MTVTLWGSAKQVADRTVVFHKGDPATHAYVLLRGAIEIRHDEPSGMGVVVKILAAPNFFGVIEQLGDEPHYLEAVQTLGACHIGAMTRQRFVAGLKQSHDWCFSCLENTATAFCLAARFEPVQLATTEMKLANYLLALFDVAGDLKGSSRRLSIKRNQADFAVAIGASERSVSRILADWLSEGLLSKSSARYQLESPAALTAIAGPLSGSLVFRGREAVGAVSVG